MKEKEKEKEHPRKSSKRERKPSKDTENIKPSNTYNETYEVTKTRYKYLRYRKFIKMYQ